VTAAAPSGVRIRWEFRPRGAPAADAAFAEIERIRRTRGRADPAILVEESRARDAALHGAFTWDDAAAAQERRIEQARAIFRALRVETIATEDRHAVAVRAMLPVEGNYRPTTSLMVGDERTALLRRAREEMVSWRRRYGHLQEFAEIVNVIDASGVA